MIETDSVAERAERLLARIDAVDAALRCYVAVDRNAVLAEAAKLDALAPGARGPLHGMTVAVKDLIDVAGLPTRAGSSFFRRDPVADAPAVAALRAAGALVIGKTNTHEFAWGVTTENPHFGRTANPWDPARIAGGSSGGSAAAVAAGLADVALGTDTLGSIRIPAALTGISGVRPATGTFSLDGIVPLAPGLDTVGPLAHDVASLRLVYEVLLRAAGMRDGAGDPARSPFAGEPALGSGPSLRTGEDAPLRACRLRGGAWERVHPAVASALDEACAALRAAGAIVEDVTWWDDALVAASGVLQQREAARVHAPWFERHREEYGDDVRARVARAFTLGERDERAARVAVSEARERWDAATRGFDVALAPAAGAEAPLAPAPATFRDEAIPLVTPASAFGLPAVAVPIGFGPAGMPLGMQIVGASGTARAFDVASLYQTLTHRHRELPPRFRPDDAL